MPEYKIVARQYGNSVEFVIQSDNTKQALADARKESRLIYDYEGVGDDPTVSVKEIKEKEE